MLCRVESWTILNIEFDVWYYFVIHTHAIITHRTKHWLDVLVAVLVAGIWVAGVFVAVWVAGVLVLVKENIMLK